MLPPNNAFVTPQNEPKFAAHAQAMLADTAPGNFLEALVANELLHASWELERVRNINNTTAYTAQFQNRASRNWRRARKTLQALQSARLAQVTKFQAPQLSNFAPLADPARIPESKTLGEVFAWEAAAHRRNIQGGK